MSKASSGPGEGVARRALRSGPPLLLILLVPLVVASCAGSSSTPDGAPNPPRPNGIASTAGSWVALPMGELSSTDNTFWQLLYAPSGSSRWSVVTPLGTADNGGLVAAVSGDAVLAGVLPSGLLRFSPLSSSSDAGRTWSPALLPGSLATVPEALALATGPAGKALAVVPGRALEGPPSGSSWSTLVSLATLRRASPGCGGGPIQAAAITPAGAELLGVECRDGVGLFADESGVWRRTGPVLGGVWRTAATSVFRLVSTGSSITALIASERSGRTRLVALWQSASGSWSASPTLSVGTPKLAATSVGPDGEVAVLAGTARRPGVWEVASGSAWARLANPPQETVALAQSGGGGSTVTHSLDAFTVRGTALGVYALVPPLTSWLKVQSNQVPLAYGSSS